MWQCMGACDMGWAHVTRPIGIWQGRVWVWGHMVEAGDMFQGVGACGRVWDHVAGGEGEHTCCAISNSELFSDTNTFSRGKCKPEYTES